MNIGDPEALSIGDLADAAGLSRRAIRFYIQQRLLPPPISRGRGSSYNATHLQRLRRIAELQAAGHSLDAIRRLLDAGNVQTGGQAAGARPAPAPAPGATPRPRPTLSAKLFTRLDLGRGIEVHYDAARHNPTVEQLAALRTAVRAILLNEWHMGPAAAHAAPTRNERNPDDDEPEPHHLNAGNHDDSRPDAPSAP